MDIKKIFTLLIFAIALIGIIAPASAVTADKKVKLTLDANGGKIWNVNSGKFDSKKISTWKKGSKVDVNSIPQRSGYEFKGWYTKKSGGTKITKIMTMKKSATLYAHWKISGLKIKIEYNGKFTSGYGTNTKNRKGFHSEGYYEEFLKGASYINIGAEKSDGSNRKLTISVLKGDKVVAKKTTTHPYGEVKIYYKS